MIENPVLIEGKRLQRTANAAGIPFVEAVEWETVRGYPRKTVIGIEVDVSNAERMRELIARRSSRRKTPAERAAAKERRQQRDSDRLAAAIRSEFPSMPEAAVTACADFSSEIGSGRVGRSSSAENPARSAVIAFIRHRRTDYDKKLSEGWDREEARREVAPHIAACLSEWEKPKHTHDQNQEITNR